MLCSLLSSLTELATSSDLTSAPEGIVGQAHGTGPEPSEEPGEEEILRDVARLFGESESEAAKKALQVQLKEQLLHVFLALCLPEGPSSLDLGEGLNGMEPFQVLGNTVDLRGAIQEYIYKQLETSLSSVADQVISTLFSEETRERLVLGVMETLHSAVGSPLAAPPGESPSSTPHEGISPSLFDGVMRKKEDIPQEERLSAAERNAEEEALVAPLKGFIEAIVPQIFPQEIRSRIFQQMPSVEMARKIAAPCVSLMESIDLKKFLANAVRNLPGYMERPVESVSQEKPRLQAIEEERVKKQREEEREKTKARLNQLTGEEGVRALTEGIGKTASQYLRDYIKTSPGLGMRFLRVLDRVLRHSLINGLALVVKFFVNRLLKRSWKPQHLKAITAF